MVVSLLSFFKAINVLESLLHFTKIFTTFSAVYLVSVLITADKRNVLYLSIVLTMLLIFDSMTVLSGIKKYINGSLSVINDIKSIYSNKNVFASSVFVKIPFALWLMVFNRKWLRSLGIFGTFMAILATLFLSSRTFYLGLFGLTIMLIIFFIIRFIQLHDKYYLRSIGVYLILLLFAFLIFSTTQRYLYPKTQDLIAVNVGDRLTTINTSDASAAARLDAWKRSWHVFREEPILGVGLGNWKIATLKEENLTKDDFIYSYKAHNDFIEITTETGIFGGLFFISLFLLTGWAFIRAVVKKITPEWIALLFLPVVGLFCYSIDAFFNFPQDRPEIQAFFAIYLGGIVAFTSLIPPECTKPSIDGTTGHTSVLQLCRTLLHIKAVSNVEGKSGKSFYRNTIIFFYGLVLIVSAYILYLNFNSVKLQRIIYNDIFRKKFDHPASMFLTGFPVIPTISVEGEPIAVQKARYLIDEQRFDEAIALLKKDKSSPFDARREFFIASSYILQNNIDNGMAYSQKMYDIKPYYFQNVTLLCNLLRQKGMGKQVEVILDKYLSKVKNNKEAWLYATTFYSSSGNIQKASSLIDTAAIYYPSDSEILKLRKAILLKVIIGPYQALYDAASSAYNSKKYNVAVRYYSELLAKKPEFTEVRICRALCYFFLKEYTKSNQDWDFLIFSGVSLAGVYNQRGLNYAYLGNIEEACKNFKIAADMGDKDGLQNYSKICKPGKK
jgi:O-antigen ligase/tetratricopeptide (TPR) repeat protein